MRLEVWDESSGGVELIFYKAAVMEASFMASREREREVCFAGFGHSEGWASDMARWRKRVRDSGMRRGIDTESC